MPRLLRYTSLTILYGLCAFVSFYLAWELRFGFYRELDGIPQRFRDARWWQLLYVVPLKLICLYAFGQFSGLVSYFRMPDAIRLFAASVTATSLLLLGWVFAKITFAPPGSVTLADFILFTSLVAGSRVVIRLFCERREGGYFHKGKTQLVGIIGAGQVGSSLASEFLSRPALHMRPVAFFDDDSSKHGKRLHGIPIVGTPDKIPSYHLTHALDKLVLAASDMSHQRVRKIVELAENKGIPVEIVPSVMELVSGKYRSMLTRKIQIEDLLYRDSVKIDLDIIRQSVTGKVVMVTGAGGSIGGELCQQLAGLNPATLIMLDRCEGAVFLINKLLEDRHPDLNSRVRIADVRDPAQMKAIFAELKPEIIYHAAAHKHVGLMEVQPREAFSNNTLATLNLARMAVASGVKSFCLISTDKAVNPSSVMGASKRLAELALQALVANHQAGETKFSIVRFGNVAGSSGSVIPIFERQIDEGGPVTVTHPEMTRYFMTIPEAVGLVLQAVAFSGQGDLFTLDMGEPVRIDDVARDLIRLKGYEPDVDIKIIYTGIRPGEKISETLNYPHEQLQKTTHPKIQKIIPTDDPRSKDIIKEIEGLLGVDGSELVVGKRMFGLVSRL